MKKHYWLWFLVCCLMCASTFGQQTHTKNDNTFTIYFHVGKSNYDPSFRNNHATMARMISRIEELSLDTSAVIRSIKVSSATSPEGGKKLNVNLATARSMGVVQNLKTMYPDLTQQIVISSELAPDWQMLYTLVDKSNMPMRQQTLDLLTFYRDYYSPDLSVTDPREVQLKLLDNGKVWKYMLDNFYPDLRYATVELLHDYMDTSSPLLEQVMPPVITTTQAADNPYPTTDDASERNFLFAIKSNLLFDVAGAFNGEIEVPIADKFSVQAEVIWPWYVDGKDKWCYQMGAIDGELRYWLKGNNKRATNDINPLTGHFLGLTGGWGYYDYEKKNKGRQGEFFTAGLTYGYGMRLTKNFNMEFSLGVGYARTKYRHYNAMEIDGKKQLVRQNNDHANWIGPIKAKVSLCWLLFNHK